MDTLFVEELVKVICSSLVLLAIIAISINLLGKLGNPRPPRW